MALISCPHCGKRITDRTEVCPHCKTVLIQKNNESIISKESILSDGKKNVPSIAIATAEAFVLARLIGAVCGIICNVFMGENGKRAFSEGSRAFQPYMFVILFIGLIALCVLPTMFERITKVKARTFVKALSIVLAIIFGISFAPWPLTYRLLQAPKDAHGYSIVGDDIVSDAIVVVFFYAVTLPLYQGMFYLLNRNENRKKGYISQVIFAAIALVITVILAVVLVAFFGMGTLGAAFAGAIASLLMFIAASLRKE